MTLGEKIRAARMNLGLTQKELADKVGVKYQAIQKYESGLVDNLPLYRVQQLADALEVTPSYLLGWGEKKKQLTEPDELSSVKQELITLIKSLSDDEVAAVLKILKR